VNPLETNVPGPIEIRWEMTAEQIHNLVSGATHPSSGAFALLRGEKTLIWQTKMPESRGTKSGTKPGTVFVRSGRPCVACGDGLALELLSLQRPGGPELAGIEFARLHLATPIR